MTRPDNTVECWLFNSEEFKQICDGDHSKFFFRYLYFKFLGRINENTIEGSIGHTNGNHIFHEQIVDTYGYFKEYQNHQAVYFTMNKIDFYLLKEIIPLRPLNFIFSRVSIEEQNETTKIATKSGIARHRLHFEDLGGGLFEELVFAFVRQEEKWDSIKYLGETGHDRGRDIVGIVSGKSFCYFCANYKTLTIKKVDDDIDKLIRHSNIPDNLIVVCGGRITENVRKKILKHATNMGIKSVDIWSGKELEEVLRHKAPSIIERFF